MATQAFRLIEPGPDRRHIVSIVAREPCVLRFVGGTGFACDIRTVHRQSAATGAAFDHVLQHAVEDVDRATVNNPFRHDRCWRCARGIQRVWHHVGRQWRCFWRSVRRCATDGRFADRFRVRVVGRHCRRIGDEQGFALAVFDFLDEVRADLVTAVGKRTPAADDFHWCQGCGTQCQRQVGRQILLVEAKAGDVVDRGVHAQALQQADRHEVTRLVQRFTQPNRTEEGAGVVLWPPDFVDGLVDEYDRRIVDQAGGGVAVVQRCRIQERLEAGARLTLGLHRAVVVALLERETADQRTNRAVLRIQRNQRALRHGKLAELERVVRLTLQAHQIADMGDITGLLGIGADAVGVQERLGPLHAVPGDGLLVLAVAGQYADAGLVDLGDNGWLQTTDRALFAQLLHPALAGQAGEPALRPAIAMALVVFDQTVLHRLVGVFLQAARHGSGDAEAFCVGCAAITTHHFGPRHFSDIRRIHFRTLNVIAGVDRLDKRGLVGVLVDFPQFEHAAQNPVAALFGTHRVGQWVES